METYKLRLEKLADDLYIEDKKLKIAKLEELIQDEKIWKDWEEGQRIAQDLADLKRDIEEFEMLELYLLEEDFSSFEKEIRKLEIKTFLSGKHDKDSAILSVHAGQGGVEAMDWVEMLERTCTAFLRLRNRRFS